MGEFIKTYGKAIAAFLGTLGSAVGTALLDGSVTSTELIIALGATLVTTFATYQASYQPEMNATPVAEPLV